MMASIFLRSIQNLCLFSCILLTPRIDGLTPVKQTRAGISQRTSLKTLSATPVVGDSFDQRKGKETIPEDLIRSLDLVPLLKGISKHAATCRGRQALLSTVGEADFQKRKPQNKKFTTARRKRVMESSLFENHPTKLGNKSDKETLAPIASSPTEARKEYELVEQALLALQETNDLSIPPLYGVNSSPWDTGTLADTDFDEWLSLPIDMWTLENVIQADKVVETLLRIRSWVEEDASQTWMPGLAEIGAKISKEPLERLSSEIKGAVEIVRHRSLVDPRGNKSFTFRLNASKFPSLSNLYQQELKLAEKIDRELAIDLRKQQGSNESLEFQGRKVLSLPKSAVSASLGIVRGKSDTGGRAFVEPHRTVALGDELAKVRQEIDTLQQEIQLTLIQSIMRASMNIDEGLRVMARIDIVMAKAAFGTLMNGTIPKVGNEGIIDVNGFLHPVLAIREQENSHSPASVVPIDLRISQDQGARALIISGPNGGGKTVALKSFGLACLLVKLGIPFPSPYFDSKPRADFFDDVLVQVGDAQSVSEGESTLMARLNGISSLIQKVSETPVLGSNPPHQPRSSLILLDELGGGTDPTAGGAIAQAVLEKLLETDSCRIVATTHSPQLKSLSAENEDFSCATVLLQPQSSGPSGIRMPTFQLKYGLTGDSYALSAAFRCRPSLPEDVLSRAANLISSENPEEGSDRIRALTLSLDQQTQAIEDERIEAEKLNNEIADIRDSMLKLAAAYEMRLNSLEQRLGHCFEGLQADETKGSVELVGETLGELRLVKKKMKTEADLLRERGLKMVSDSYHFTDGESVVILAKGEFEGETGKIALRAPGSQQQVSVNEVVVVPSWGMTTMEDALENPMLVRPLILKRSEIAIWDYESVWDDVDPQPSRTMSIRESQQKLFDKLSSVKSSPGTNSSKSTKTNTFTSSRQRKAAKKKKK